jgi:glutamate synthase domain-containing protein 3
MGLVDLVPLEEEDILTIKKLIQEHQHYTGSSVAQSILDDWDNTVSQFIKVYPRDYRRVLEERKNKAEKLGEVA